MTSQVQRRKTPTAAQAIECERCPAEGPKKVMGARGAANAPLTA
jgi:hypothetical protein